MSMCIKVIVSTCGGLSPGFVSKCVKLSVAVHNSSVTQAAQAGGVIWAAGLKSCRRLRETFDATELASLNPVLLWPGPVAEHLSSPRGPGDRSVPAH